MTTDEIFDDEKEFKSHIKIDAIGTHMHFGERTDGGFYFSIDENQNGYVIQDFDLMKQDVIRLRDYLNSLNL